MLQNKIQRLGSIQVLKQKTLYMETYPLLNTVKVMNCIEQIKAGDIFLLFLNPVFSMALVCIIPIIAIIWGFLSANNKFSLHSVVESILSRTKLCAYPLLCPIYYSSLTFPAILIGWFHLIVGSSKLGEVVVTSPALFPWITYATRIHPEQHINNVDYAHSAWMNQIWVTYEPSKHILLQWVDFFIYHYVLVCSVVVIFVAVLSIVASVLFVVIYGNTKTRMIVDYDFELLKIGPIASLFFFIYPEELEDKEDDHEDKTNFTLSEYLIYWISRLVSLLDSLLSPYVSLSLVLPFLSGIYEGEALFLVARAPFDPWNIGLNSADLHTLFEIEQHALHTSAWYMYPVHKLVFAHMECVHAFWSFINMM